MEFITSHYNSGRVKYLKGKSDTYPELYIEEFKNGGFCEVTICTFVRLKHDEKWYLLFAVDSIVGIIHDVEFINKLHQNMHRKVHLIQSFHRFTGIHEELDIDQREEDERLLERYKIDSTYKKTSIKDKL